MLFGALRKQSRKTVLLLPSLTVTAVRLLCCRSCSSSFKLQKIGSQSTVSYEWLFQNSKILLQWGDIITQNFADDFFLLLSTFKYRYMYFDAGKSHRKTNDRKNAFKAKKRIADKNICFAFPRKSNVVLLSLYSSILSLPMIPVPVW